MIVKRVAKNALVLILATTGQEFVAFITLTIIARLVGVEIAAFLMLFSLSAIS